MARTRLELPESFHFSTVIPIRITDVNYGGHVGNDSILSIIHEARVRFLMQHGFTEFSIGGPGMIMADAVIVFKSESFYGETLVCDLAIADVHKHGYDILYRLTEQESKREVARVKTSFVCFDYEARKIVELPAEFSDVFLAKLAVR